MKRAFFSWSGGKDSMLALHRALDAGYRVEFLLAMFDEQGERSRSHGLSPHLLRAQAEALGIPLVMRRASWATYETEFIAATTAFAAMGLKYGLFGDIDLEPHRAWEEKVCGAAGIEAVLPLWHEPRRELVNEFLALEYRARVVCTNARWLDGSFCGRLFDAAFLRDLPPEVDACGENGEFHTFVFDGPRFAKPVTHRLVAVHEQRFESPAPAVFYVAELA
ncbi:MAG: diphthine--ammonia ligase [Polyangiaceae bacterium]